MAYPIIPLIQTWDNPLSQAADIASTKYGKSGVEQRKLKGINPLSNSIDVNVNIRNFIEVDNFLDRKSTRLNSSHVSESRMPSSA